MLCLLFVFFHSLSPPLPPHGTNVHVILTVLSTLADDDVNNISVTVGNTATFSCKFEKRDTNFSIIWKVGRSEYCSNNMSMIPDVIICSVKGNTSFLQITDTSVTGAGTHEVQCIFQPDIDPRYIMDPSFQSEFNNGDTRTATLEVIGITSTMGELFQPCVSYFHSLS